MTNDIRNPAPALSFNERLEAQCKYMDAHRVDYSNVEAVLVRPESYNSVSYVKEWFMGANIVTNAGDTYYSIMAIGGTPATNENFAQARCELANPGSQTAQAKADTYSTMATPITASRKTIEATYPRRDGATDDTDNTGGGSGATSDIVSYKYSWATGDFNATGIKNGCLHDNASPVSGTKLLTHYGVTTFTKDAASTLKIFVNHTMNGT
jgi:hypothetical protein